MDLFPGTDPHADRAQESAGILMARYEFKLPDIGEGIAEAEIVAWHVKVGDRIEEDQQIADMMTDKATVEMEAPVSGTVVELAGEVGDQIPIGSVLVVIDTANGAAAEEVPLADGAVEPTPAMEEEIPTTDVEEDAPTSTASRPSEAKTPRTDSEEPPPAPLKTNESGGKALASPAVRQ